MPLTHQIGPSPSCTLTTWHWNAGGKVAEAIIPRVQHIKSNTARLRITFCSRYAVPMVGPPKTLHDLRRVEAAVRIACRACKRTVLRDREELISERFFQRRSCEWPAVQTDMPCPHCGDPDVRVDAIPFGQDNTELRARRARMLLMNLALKVLADAARTAKSHPEALATVDATAVRLALRILHPFVRDQAMLTTFWVEVTATERKPWSGAQQALRWIVKKLLDRGYSVWAELR